MSDTCPFCHWPPALESGLCMRHSYEFTVYWEPLADFGPIPEDNNV